jgi:acid phosphatase type 7
MTARLPFTLSLLGLCTSLSAAEKSPFTRGPYPQLATPDGVSIVWRTRGAMLPELRIGTAPDKLTSAISYEHFTVRRRVEDGPSTGGEAPLHSAPSGTTQFEAPVTGLQPGTRYYYGIYDTGKLLTPADGSCTFTTLPAFGSETPCTFWVVGDSGTGTASQKAVHEAFKSWRTRTKTPVDFYMHVGDMAYNKGMDSEFQFGFFDIYADTLRGLTCWPAMGNHEGGTSKGSKGTGPYYDSQRHRGLLFLRPRQSPLHRPQQLRSLPQTRRRNGAVAEGRSRKNPGPVDRRLLPSPALHQRLARLR